LLAIVCRVRRERDVVVLGAVLVVAVVVVVVDVVVAVVGSSNKAFPLPNYIDQNQTKRTNTQNKQRCIRAAAAAADSRNARCNCVSSSPMYA
jgi:hypothetical protein